MKSWFQSFIHSNWKRLDIGCLSQLVHWGVFWKFPVWSWGQDLFQFYFQCILLFHVCCWEDLLELVISICYSNFRLVPLFLWWQKTPIKTWVFLFNLMHFRSVSQCIKVEWVSFLYCQLEMQCLSSIYIYISLNRSRTKTKGIWKTSFPDPNHTMLTRTPSPPSSYKNKFCNSECIFLSLSKLNAIIVTFKEYSFIFVATLYLLGSRNCNKETAKSRTLAKPLSARFWQYLFPKGPTPDALWQCNTWEDETSGNNRSKTTLGNTSASRSQTGVRGIMENPSSETSRGGVSPDDSPQGRETWRGGIPATLLRTEPSATVPNTKQKHDLNQNISLKKKLKSTNPLLTLQPFMQ